MDPFNEVQDDAWSTIGVLQGILHQRQTRKGNITDLQLDFNNNYQEFQEIFRDLEQAIAISELQPSKFGLTNDSLIQRRAVLGELKSKVSSIQNEWDNKREREVTTMSNRISQDAENPFLDQFTDQGEQGTSLQQQEVIQEQDLQLDSIHETMKNLNQQANLMGLELEEQGFMLDQLDGEIDHVGGKLLRGMKRVNNILERNKERASDWCIGILVFALCILLVLVIAL